MGDIAGNTKSAQAVEVALQAFLELDPSLPAELAVDHLGRDHHRGSGAASSALVAQLDRAASGMSTRVSPVRGMGLR